MIPAIKMAAPSRKPMAKFAKPAAKPAIKVAAQSLPMTKAKLVDCIAAFANVSRAQATAALRALQAE